MTDATTIILTLATHPGQNLDELASRLRCQPKAMEPALAALQLTGAVQCLDGSWSLTVSPAEAISRFINLQVASKP